MPDAHATEQQDEAHRPTHPTVAAALMMIGIVVLLLVLAVVSTVG